MEREAEIQLDRDFARLAAGDRSALPIVFRSLWPTIRQFCQRYLDHDADADDAAQRAIEKLFAQVVEYDPTRSALAWALTVALWECRSTRRASGRRRVASLEAELESPEPSPEQSLEREELHAALAAAIGHLSTMDQAVLATVMADVDRGELQGGSTFRKRKERAITRLKDVWRRLYGI
jgi:RNA polymerase sigma factor (sigma-70 family)